ncbi:MAG TPA: MYXO-CTERM sorting domain-containing protein [Polyangia bacterium]|nr:MYXO-CTERM sorting domain-containing protein [Polyangia bacterium]
MTVLTWLARATAAHADTIVLYGNDFEQPNVTLAATCATLDPLGINAQYGTAEFVFHQVNTVEAVLVEATSAAGARVYSDPEGKGGKFTLGMLSSLQDDKLSLTFDAKKLPFLNVAMDLSAIDVPGCGGPFGVAAPAMKLSLLDSPGGVFDWASPVLSERTVTGVAPPDAFTFTWQRVVAALDASKSTDGHVSIVFDLTASGYAAFDNLSITASTGASIVDSDLDGKPDDADNCRKVKNADQANQDNDRAGDACDPAPLDPSVCGDQDGDGKDDCACGAECPADGSADDGGQTDVAGTADSAGDGARADDAGVDAAAKTRASGCSCGVTETSGARNLGVPVLVAAAALFLLRRRRQSTVARAYAVRAMVGRRTR